MPDWSYRTVFRPVLFRLPAAVARDLCLGVIGRRDGRRWGRSLSTSWGICARRAAGANDPGYRIRDGRGARIWDRCEDRRARRPGTVRVWVRRSRTRDSSPAAEGAGGYEVERRMADGSISAPLSSRQLRGRGAWPRGSSEARRRVSGGSRLAVSPGVSTSDAADEIRLMTGVLAPHVSVLAIDPIGVSAVGDEASWCQFLDVAIRALLNPVRGVKSGSSFHRTSTRSRPSSASVLPRRPVLPE